MTDAKDFLKTLKQHDKLAIRISSNDNHGHIPEDIYRELIKPHRKLNYFFIFVIKGQSTHTVDLQKMTVADGQLLFVLPHQMHLLPPKKEQLEYYKLSFDQNCLALLPKQFSFLVNPLNRQLLALDADVQQRVKSIFEMLMQLLQSKDSAPELILANLNTLLTEFDRAYFNSGNNRHIINGNLSKFVAFKQLIEAELTEQPSIPFIAEKLALTDNSLYYIVKNYSGLSPKEYITNRLVLEAQRKIFYDETSAKELAFALGFNDPDYFSRLFRKKTGKSIMQFAREVQDLSGN